jgi:hypothetical protein
MGLPGTAMVPGKGSEYRQGVQSAPPSSGNTGAPFPYSHGGTVTSHAGTEEDGGDCGL